MFNRTAIGPEMTVGSATGALVKVRPLVSWIRESAPQASMAASTPAVAWPASFEHRPVRPGATVRRWVLPSCSASSATSAPSAESPKPFWVIQPPPCWRSVTGP
ncbi:Uncharacterised protein [Mycobacteroides abscessus subsp. abscessus]|nr:Uncharacterised protein [Mycobacteroides abscessus subsp. abscessus]